MTINEIAVFALLIIGCVAVVTAAIFVGALLVGFSVHSTPMPESEEPVAAGSTSL